MFLEITKWVSLVNPSFHVSRAHGLDRDKALDGSVLGCV